MNRTQKRVLLVSILASIVAFLDGNVVAIAMPSIARSLGGGLALQQWVNDAYLLTLGTLILAAGSLSDIFGRKRILQYGLVGFLVTSLLCAFAPTGVILVIGRALQGMSGALIVPSSLALIISVFSGTGQSKAIGRWTAWTGLSFILGPLVGGSLVSLDHRFGWRLVFLINVLPIVISLLLLARLKLDATRDTASRIDLTGILLVIGGLSGVVFALIEQAAYGFNNLVIYGAFTAGLLLLVSFVLHERRTLQPMLPLSLFNIRNFCAGNVSTFFIYAALGLQGFVLVIFLQQVGGFSPTSAGLAGLPISIIMFFLSSRFGALAGRLGPRLFMTLGPIICGLGTLLLLSVGTPVHYWSQVFPAMIIFGLGLSMTVAPLTSAILGSIKAAHAGIGSAFNNAVARIAGLISVALAGVVSAGSLGVGGFDRSIIFCAVLLIAGGVISGFGITNRQAGDPAMPADAV